jgi:hypothetical protein
VSLPGDSTAPTETRKGRAEWTYWAGTASDIAQIAQTALHLVNRVGREAEMELAISAPAFDTTLVSPDQIETGLRPEDLKEITDLSLDVVEGHPPGSPHRIAVNITRPRPRRSSQEPRVPAVKLAVTGPDRDWVDLATLRMTEQLGAGARSIGRVRYAMRSPPTPTPGSPKRNAAAAGNLEARSPIGTSSAT